MARRFIAASSEQIILGLGQLGFAFGPGTLYSVVRIAGVAANQFIFSAGASNAADYGLRIDITTGNVTGDFNGTNPLSGTPLTVGHWCYVAMDKATGNVAPRFHIYDYATNTWTHITAALAAQNSGVPLTRAQIGANPAGTGAFFNGDIEFVAVSKVVHTDAVHESIAQSNNPLAAIQNWVGPQTLTNFAGGWPLEGRPDSATLIDYTGHGANETSRVGTIATVDNWPLAEPQDLRRPARRPGLLGYGTPRRLGREREIEQLFRALISTSTVTVDSGSSSFALVAGTTADKIADAGTSSFALVTAGTDKVTDRGTNSSTLATVKTLEAISDAGSSSFTLATAGSGGPGDVGASTTTLVTATVLEAIADTATTLVILLTGGSEDEIDAGTSTLVIVGTSAEELVDQGSSDVVLVTGTALEAIADEGSSSFELVTSGVEGIAFSDSGESDFILDTAGAEAFADAATSPLELDAVSSGEAIADAGASDVILLTFGADSNSGTSTFTLTTGGIEGAQWGTSTFELVTSGSELVEVIDAGTSLVILQTGGAFTPSMRGASIVRLLTGGTVLNQAGASTFRLVTGGRGYVSEPIQSGESAIVISTRGVGVVIGPGIITTEESCCIDLAEPVPSQYRN